MSRTSTLRSGSRAGFTLTEVIIALVIIGVLGAIVGLNMIGVVGGAKVTATKATMANVQAALKIYYTTYNTYPSTLQVLVDAKQLEEYPKDAWNQPIDYYSPTTSYAYEMISRGEDQLPQTADDINVHPVNPNSP